jgi:predicted nucleic acid-binding protein
LNLYAESSAILSWLLSEGTADHVRQALASAEIVFASELTLVECDRALVRAVRTGQLSEADSIDRAATLGQAAGHWTLLRLDSEIMERARRPFPEEPLRTLDALHLASALVARRAVLELSLLSLDRRVRRCGSALGLPLEPNVHPI